MWIPHHVAIPSVWSCASITYTLTNCLVPIVIIKSISRNVSAIGLELMPSCSHSLAPFTIVTTTHTFPPLLPLYHPWQHDWRRGHPQAHQHSYPPTQHLPYDSALNLHHLYQQAWSWSQKSCWHNPLQLWEWARGALGCILSHSKPTYWSKCPSATHIYTSLAPRGHHGAQYHWASTVMVWDGNPSRSWLFSFSALYRTYSASQGTDSSRN